MGELIFTAPEGGSPQTDKFEICGNAEPSVEVDKTALKELIDMANGLNPADYTEESFAVVKSALASAQAVYDNEQATEEEVKKAEETLQSAIDALVKAEDPGEETVSKKILEYFLNSAKEHVENGDTDDCVQSIKDLFTEAIAEGETVMADENATREEVVSAAAKLMKAIQALDMKAGNKTDLEMAVELADMIDLSKYVEAGQQEFTDALAAAKEVLADGDAMQGDIDAAWNALADAMANLRLKADKSVLEDLINEAAGLDLSNYTEESAAVFKTALASAQAVFADDTLTEDDQQAVDDAVAALKQARDGLVAKSTGTDENPGGGEDQKPDGSNGTGGTSNTAGSGSKTDGTPKTGDTAPVGAGMAVTFMALAAIGAAVALRKKKAQ